MFVVNGADGFLCLTEIPLYANILSIVSAKWEFLRLLRCMKIMGAGTMFCMLHTKYYIIYRSELLWSQETSYS